MPPKAESEVLSEVAAELIRVRREALGQTVQFRIKCDVDFQSWGATMKVAAALAVVMGTFGVAHAQTDSVTGSAGYSDGYRYFSVNAISGPSGEDASGSFVFSTYDFTLTGVVTAMCVSGNAATMLGEVDEDGSAYAGYTLLFYVEDRSSAGLPDLFGFAVPKEAGPALGSVPCPGSTMLGGYPMEVGDLVVIDSLTPAQQLDVQVPCSESLTNHGEYMRSVAQWVESMVEAGMITDAEGEILLSTRAQSDCGM